MSTKTILLTGGRAPATLDLARQLHETGFRIVIAESVFHHLCQGSKVVDLTIHVPPPRQQPTEFIHALLSIVEQQNVSHLIPTCEEIFTIAKARDQFPSSCQVWTESIDCLDQLHNKWSFVQIAEQAGWQPPQTWLIRSRDDLFDLRRRLPATQSMILKPVYSRFASQVIRLFDSRTPIPESWLITPEQPWIMQEWIEGELICTYSFVRNGHLLAYAAYPSVFTLDGGACISFQFVDHQPLQQRIASWVAKYHWTGQIAFDWIYTSNDEWIPIECNPRTTSGIHLLATRPWTQYLEEDLSADVGCFTPHPTIRRMIGPAMWTFGLCSVRSITQLRSWWEIVTTSRDVCFQIKDPKPAWNQLRLMLDFWLLSRKQNLSLQEATTFDIEWNGDKT